MARGRRSTTLALVLAVIALIGCAFVGGMADAKSDGAAFLAVRGERTRARDDGMVR